MSDKMNEWKERLEQFKKDENEKYFENNWAYIDGVLTEFETLKQFIQSELDKKAEEVIDYIAETQGWEETEDIYRKHFGFKQKYIKSEAENE